MSENAPVYLGECEENDIFVKENLNSKNMAKYKISERTALLLDAVVMSEKLSEVARVGAVAYGGEAFADAEQKRFYEAWKPLNELLENRLLNSIVENVVTDGETI